MQLDLPSGSILLSFDTPPENMENIRAGRLRAYAATALTRTLSVPEVPEVAAALKAAAFQERLATVGIVSGEMTRVEFAGFVAGQVATMGVVVRAMGIKND